MRLATVELREGGRRPFVLSCGGFDPCGGAGVLRDVLAFEAMGAQGLAVVTAQTVQHDLKFCGVHDEGWALVSRQLDLLAERYAVRVIKIGLVPCWSFLVDLLERLRKLWPQARIVWDPILSASAGGDLHLDPPSAIFEDILKAIDLWTPNLLEAQRLLGTTEADDLRRLSHTTAMYLKGGHASGTMVMDTLYSEGRLYEWVWERIPGGETHGSGCAMSSLIAAAWAQDDCTLDEACQRAQPLLKRFLGSTTGLLGHF